MKDDDDEDTGTTHTRYPCIPSRVMLFQMNNQLHLAHLGKKLMKMTALATMKELRRIAAIILPAYKDYERCLRDCYILLARCRYFYPQLNIMVIEGLQLHPKTATVYVTTGVRCITGAKVMQYLVHRRQKDHFSVLAIGQGGAAVNEAKNAWYELLKSMILILELKVAFITVETAHRNANKNYNYVRKKYANAKTRFTLKNTETETKINRLTTKYGDCCETPRGNTSNHTLTHTFNEVLFFNKNLFIATETLVC